ncbi:uncharacterized protein BKCO1_730001 [Diplodia corticola]|uniref:Uncharacterized protein n=1 Tax=Diplodia corticola TaxID=236234 RepID=A0A1J9RBC4_9PEZI|nr:uncharacterized protein BKCO1_730001 [Diplodia corticola]OJD29731.1 hypothetical protein BKCO1_730001 [Diplodia corticola]
MGSVRMPRSRSPAQSAPRKQSPRPAAPQQLSTKPAHSKPMVIPVRSQPQQAPQPARSRGPHGSRKHRSSSEHHPNAVPPAVAALLAVTSIPRPRRASSPRRRLQYADRRISIDELIEEWRAEDKEISPGSYGSPLDILLERVEDCDTDDSLSFDGSQKERGFASPRSISSESIPSVPDLDEDRSILSWSSPSTPRSPSLARRAGERREKRVVSSPPKEEAILDHPLLHYGFVENEDETPEPPAPEVKIERQAPASRLKSAFTSNLTASIQALKSAAKSFSNFTAPSVPPDDLLTRSLLSPRFASEMRPKNFQGTPDPALRRYLNPSTSNRTLSPTELSQQLHEALLHGQPVDDPSDGPMIQMQTYERRSRSQSRGKRRTTDPASEAGRALSPQPAVRQREPRENSDFLRVIVLEMNMRREGKLDARALGKARIWLPPRKTGARSEEEDAVNGVPVRWVGVLADAR